MRKEKDILGEVSLSDDCYYGINTKRALNNFNVSGKMVNRHLILELVLIKKAAAIVNGDLGQLSKEVSDSIILACDDILMGNYREQFVTDALQGGAGTSTNMNVNEVIANIALEKLGKKKGDYDAVHPLNHVNMSQSTNDVYPTALKIASIRALRQLADQLAELQEVFQEKENEFADILKLGRTQMMDALPIMLGQEFGAYARAIARDRWRVYKVEERLRQVNLGGTAIGTGMNASHKFIYMMTDTIQSLTGMGISRSEFPIDQTQNMDVFVEVSGLLKAVAVNLIKISNDLRLMGSGPKGGFGEIILPKVQAGSTIMPGKVNPVMAEMVATVSMKVIGNDLCITQAASNGSLELNPFVPLIAESLLESLEILSKGIEQFRELCVEDIEANEAVCLGHLTNSTALVTALVHHIGYDQAASLAKEALESNKTVEALVLKKELMDEDVLKSIFNPYQITSPGIPGK